MTTTAGSLPTVPESPPSAPALRAADQGVADALESVLSDNTRRVYGASGASSPTGATRWSSSLCRPIH